MNEVLYRFFDEHNNLLYVGISNDWTQRLKQHYKNSDFFTEAAFITLERFETREEVELAEKVAIAQEQPKYNKAFNPFYENGISHIKKISGWVYRNIEPDSEHEKLVKVLQYLWRTEPLWTKKTNGPLAFYLQEYLPFWSNELPHDCEYCVNIWHSKQVSVWGEEYRKRINAIN